MSRAGGDLDALEAALRYRFRERRLLERALTHSSFAQEASDPAVKDNEVFEFLGDALVGFLVADGLHRRDPEGDEGTKTLVRAGIVSEASLAAQAAALGVPDLLRLDRGEQRTGGRSKVAILADALEALLAAVYLDGGIEAARGVVEQLFAAALDAGEIPATDFKTTLQERLQAAGRPLPEYRLLAEEGPPHRRTFRVACMVDGVVVAQGEGTSKKRAQQVAAERALRALRET